MDWVTGSFTTDQGIRIAYGMCIPEKPKGLVIVVHGFAEHMGRYKDFIGYLYDNGFGVYSMDHIGHGKSGNIKGYVKEFGHMIESVDFLVRKAKKENPELPVIMFGHSMGGLITLAYGLKYPEKLTGQIFSGPALGITMSGGVKFFLGLARKINPWLNIKNPVTNLICKDKNVVEEYKNDSLVLHKATVSLYYQVFIKGTEIARVNMARYKYPCLILHGEDDKIVNPELSRELYDTCASQDKAIKFYDGLYHEILNEPEKDLVKSDILKWLEDTIKKYK